MTVGERVKAARKQAGMTQGELAERLGISYVGVSQWESGRRNPKESTLERIAEVLDVPLGYLTGAYAVGFAELDDFVKRAWPRADHYVKKLQENDGDAKEIERWESICTELLKIQNEIRASQQAEQIQLSDQEKRLLEIFRSLNSEGRRKILTIMDDYAKIEKYLVLSKTDG